ncbi:MAG TPA: putative collagen-binding domain-containing protein, partial [Caldilineaceae bacterium]|nr:putative collagen-binding domain-containing protein [Caldilineaceae bacterium]
GYKLEGGGYDMNNPNDVSLRKNLGYTHDYANRINLALMTPRGDLASSKYVLANPVASGAEYLVYLPNGGNVTVDLSATEGELKVEWFNPATGVTTTSDTVNGGAKRSFSAPFGGDAVLYLYQQGPPPATHQLFVPIVGKGKVSMSPSGPYTEGQMVTLTANPAAGWSFSSWSGDFSGVSNPLTITIAADTTITATFSEVSPPQNYTLTVNATGQGQVLVEPSGPYTTGQVITLTANPATDWQFAAWSGDLVGTANPITFAITANSAVTATFVPHSETELYSLIVHLNGQGQVDFTPFGPYTSRQIITLTARPADDWVFSGWSGAITGIENPATLAITTNAVITGNFAALTNQTPYALKMTTVGRGTVVVDPPGPYSADQKVTLSALPVPGWRFDHWEGDLRGNDNPLTTAVSQTLSVTAFFSLEPLFLPFVQKEALRSTIPPLQAQTGNSDHLLNDAYRCGSPDVALILPILTLLDEFWPCIDKSGGNSPTPQPLGH